MYVRFVMYICMLCMYVGTLYNVMCVCCVMKEFCAIHVGPLLVVYICVCMHIMCFCMLCLCFYVCMLGL